MCLAMRFHPATRRQRPPSTPSRNCFQGPIQVLCLVSLLFGCFVFRYESLTEPRPRPRQRPAQVSALIAVSVSFSLCFFHSSEEAFSVDSHQRRLQIPAAPCRGAGETLAPSHPPLPSPPLSIPGVRFRTFLSSKRAGSSPWAWMAGEARTSQTLTSRERFPCLVQWVSGQPLRVPSTGAAVPTGLLKSLSWLLLVPESWYIPLHFRTRSYHQQPRGEVPARRRSSSKGRIVPLGCRFLFSPMMGDAGRRTCMSKQSPDKCTYARWMTLTHPP